MRKNIAIVGGKLALFATRLRGGGSAFPGLVAEKLDPGFLPKVLGSLPYGVVLVSGTNGKTTTTKMVADLLRGQGLKVFTNPTGSNFTRGVAASLLSEVGIGGALDAEVAVLELDEAHAVHFVAKNPPRFSLLLNVMRDQLDRFGEIDNTARLLQRIAEATTGTVVLNREDPLISALSATVSSAEVEYFGLSDPLVERFPSDDVLYGGGMAALDKPGAVVTLESYESSSATFSFTERNPAADATAVTTTVTTPLLLNGIYNVFNAAAALAVSSAVMGEKLDRQALIESLATVTPAFGRGESVEVDGLPFELVLVKNPGGFRLGLQSFDAEGYATMIAINDNYADGRDMSWLWDVDFTSLADGGVDLVSGIRAFDMAVRLDHDEVRVGKVVPDLGSALSQFISENPGRPKRVYCTYTAMLALRKELAKYTTIAGVGISG